MIHTEGITVTSIDALQLTQRQLLLSRCCTTCREPEEGSADRAEAATASQQTVGSLPRQQKPCRLSRAPAVGTNSDLLVAQTEHFEKSQK